MTKTIFVTGGAGYIGAHCCKLFSDKGWNVVVYDNLSTGWKDFVKWGELIESDILDSEALRQAIARIKPDIIAHFAALSEVGRSVKDPALYYRTNIVGALNVLDAMRINDVHQLVQSSTCATYGNPQYVPIDETHPQRPANPYGWTKLVIEQLLADHNHAHGLRYVSLRYFNAAGADPEGLIGERHRPETHVIPLALRAALDDEYTFTVYGDDYDTYDGTAVRDYVHVLDLADAHCRAIKYLAEGGTSNEFNLGTETGTSVAEIIDTVEAVIRRPVKRVFGGRRCGDPAALVSSSEKAAKILHWAPVNSNIANIVKDAYNWHQAEIYK